MIIPCEDYNSSECKNKEAVLIQKSYFDNIKGLEPKHENYTGLLMDKSDIVKVEPDVLPEPTQKTVLSHTEHIMTLDKIIKGILYYQLVPFEPFILKLGNCTKKTEKEIIFEKVKKDTHNNQAYISVTTIKPDDILNGEVLLTNSHFVGVFTKLKQKRSLNARLIKRIKQLILSSELITSDMLKFVKSEYPVSDLFGPSTPRSRSISQPRHTLSGNDFTTGESINSSSDSNSTFEDSPDSSIRTIDTSPSLSPPPPPSTTPPPSPQEKKNTPFFIRISPPKKSSRNSK